MRCACILVLCALPICLPQSGRAQQEPASAPSAPSVPPAGQNHLQSEPLGVQIDRLTKQLAELKKQRSGLIEKLVAEYRARPESQTILQGRNQARAALRAATERAIALAREDPQYRKELAKKQEMQVRLQALRASAKPDPVQITQAATAYRQANLKLAQMEDDAQDLDQQVTAAKVRLAGAEVAETDLQRRAQAYAILHEEYAALIVAIWQAETDLDRANADLRVAAALEHPEERQVARAGVDDSAFWEGGMRKPRQLMESHETKGPRLVAPLPIGPGNPAYPPIKGPMGIGQPHLVGSQ